MPLSSTPSLPRPDIHPHTGLSPKVILAYLGRGAVLTTRLVPSATSHTIEVALHDGVPARPNHWEVIIPLNVFHALQLLNLIELDSGNLDTHEQHFLAAFRLPRIPEHATPTPDVHTANSTSA